MRKGDIGKHPVNCTSADFIEMLETSKRRSINQKHEFTKLLKTDRFNPIDKNKAISLTLQNGPLDFITTFDQQLELD